MNNQFPPMAYGPDKTWIKEGQTASMTGTSLAWLRKKRQTGGGIPYFKMGKNVRYLLADVIAYMEQCKVRSTSEYK